MKEHLHIFGFFLLFFLSARSAPDQPHSESDEKLWSPSAKTEKECHSPIESAHESRVAHLLFLIVLRGTFSRQMSPRNAVGTL